MNGHTFDYSREGYCNLLLVQDKKTQNPGDSAEMISARKRFLESGHYLPILEKVLFFLKNENYKNIVDAGCGEGYYLDEISRHINPSISLSGFDISKFAIQIAAKRNKKITWLVASSKKMPFADASVDFILSLFGFPHWDSFKRAQKIGSKVLIVDPASEHLMELRKKIYPKVNKTKTHSLEHALAAGYSLVSEESLSFEINLKENEQILDLLFMTPHGFRINPEARENIAKLSELKVTADLSFRLLELMNWPP